MVVKLAKPFLIGLISAVTTLIWLDVLGVSTPEKRLTAALISGTGLLIISLLRRNGGSL